MHILIDRPLMDTKFPIQVFAIICGVFPALKARDPNVLFQYITDPVCIGVFILTVLVYFYAKDKKQVALQPWESRAAHWYLLNAAIFHLLLDWGVGNLKALPIMQQNYQAMDLRYGCIAAHPCGDQAAGQTKEMNAMVFILTWIEAAIDAPLCYLCFIAYCQGW